MVMLNNKRVLFVGPLGNPDKTFIDHFDIVIRTNGFFSIDRRILKSNRCDILIVNRLYATNYHEVINKNLPTLKYVLAKNKQTYDRLISKVDPKYRRKILYMSYTHSSSTLKIKKHPLLVSNFLLYATQYFTPKIVYFTGFDFYTSNDIKKFWLPGYATKESHVYNVLKLDKKNHDIQSNIDYFKHCLDNVRWVKCDPGIQRIVKIFGKKP